MKQSILILLTFLIAISGFAQQIDWENAPLNPVPVFYTANHYNIKGPIKEFKVESMSKEIFYLYFNEQGKLVEKITSQPGGHSKILYTYQYDTKGNLIKETYAFIDSKGNKTSEYPATIKVNSEGLVVNKGGYAYAYDKNKRLTLCTAKDQNGKENYRQEFTYNTLGQITSEKITEPHVATGVMKVEEFKFTYTKRSEGGWDIVMHIYKDGKLATRGSIPLITSSFVRQKREQIFKNPEQFSFDEAGLEAFKKDYVKVMIDQYNNLRGRFSIKFQKNIHSVNITYYNNILSLLKYKETSPSQTNATAGSTIANNTNSSAAYPIDISNKTLSAEAKNFFISYNANPKNVGNYITDIGKTMTAQNLKGAAMYSRFTEIVKEIYNVDKYIAFDIMMKVDGKTMQETLKLFPSDMRAYFNKEAKLYQQKQKETASTTTTTNSTNVDDDSPYSGLSTEAAAYMAAYRMMPKGLKKYLGNQHKSWEDKGYSAEKISQSYAGMFKEVYNKDKKAAFELIIHMPGSWLQADKLKSVFSLLTKEQQLYIQDEANRR